MANTIFKTERRKLLDPWTLPGVPPTATYRLGYGRDPSFDRYQLHEFFDTLEAAQKRARELNREGFCVGGPWKRFGRSAAKG